MTRIYSIAEEVGTARSFQSTTNGVPTDVKVIGLTLTDGKNTVFAEAFRERADLIEKLQLQKGDIVQVQMTVNAKKRDTDKGVFYSNAVMIDTIMVVTRSAF